MGSSFAVLKSILRQSLPLTFQSSAKPSVSRDASLSLATINTRIAQQVYTNKDPAFRLLKKIPKRNKGPVMSQSQPGLIPGLNLNPEVGAFTAPGAGEPLQQQLNTQVSEPPKPKTKKKKGKKSKQTTGQEVQAEARASKVQADGHTDAKVAPSLASGGVPNPSQNYILSAFKPPTTLPHPRPILIVMDLNGTILHRPANRHNHSAFVERPHAYRFMRYCLDTFHVAIWSSARPKNVNKVVAKLLEPEQVKKCVVVWSREQLGLSEEDYNTRVQCYKRLDRIWEDPDIQASHPQGGRWDQSNTVLVDDSCEKGRSEPFNILALPEFANTALERQHVLPQVHDYLNTLACQDDVSRYMQRTPFKIDPTYTLPNSGI